MVPLYIVLAIVIYLLIAIRIFAFCSKYDVFDDYFEMYLHRIDFPTKTFYFSLFWIICVPIMLICALFGFIDDEISTWGYAIYEKNKYRKKEKDD